MEPVVWFFGSLHFQWLISTENAGTSMYRASGHHYIWLATILVVAVKVMTAAVLLI